MMHENICSLSRRGTASQLLVGHKQSLFAEVAASQTVMMDLDAGFDSSRNLDHLEQENEELQRAVDELKAQLDAAEKDLGSAKAEQAQVPTSSFDMDAGTISLGVPDARAWAA